MTQAETVAQAEHLLEEWAQWCARSVAAGRLEAQAAAPGYARAIDQAVPVIRDLVALLREHDQGWRDITSAPKDGTRVMVWDGHDVQVAFFVSESYGWRSDELCSEELTHWQPLPLPPPGGSQR